MTIIQGFTLATSIFFLRNEISEKVEDEGRARCPTYGGLRTYVTVGRAPSPAKWVFQRPILK